MLRALTLTALFLFSYLGFANTHPSFYQIDMIVFTHLETTPAHDELSSTPLITPNMQYAIPLQSGKDAPKTPYHLLPMSTSHLRDEYWTLNHKSQYQVLFYYTWLQPANNAKPIALTEMGRSGWNIEGTVSIKQSNYYILDTDLLFTAASNNQMAFVFSQKQRLKPGVVYYLDHPQAGMLITVHQVA